MSSTIVLVLALGGAGTLVALHLAASGSAIEQPVISPRGLQIPPRLTPVVSARAAAGLTDAPTGVERLGTGARAATTLGTIADVQAESVLGLLLVAGGAGIVLMVVTCVNLGLLLFSTGRARRTEVAMRSVLGAGRRRIVASLLLEQMPLILLASVLGAAIVGISEEALRQSWPRTLSAWTTGSISPVQISLVVAAPLLTMALFAILPILLLRDETLGSTMAAGARITSGPDEGIVRDRATVLGIGLSTTLMIAAGLLLRGFSAQLTAASYPVQTRDTLTFTIRPGLEGLPAETEAVRLASLREALERLPHVKDAALASEGAWLGLGTTALAHSLTGAPGRPGITRPTRYSTAVPGSLSALGFTFESGRDFTFADGAGATAAVIVNRTFANRFFFGDPVGRTVQLGRALPGGTWFSVVGVVGDVRPPGIGNGAEPQPMLILSAAQSPPGSYDLVARYIGDPTAARLEIERALTSALPDASLVYTGTMAEKLGNFAAPFGWFGWIVAILAGLTTVLSIFGLHSMISFNVARRARELGIRIALGARDRAVITQILREAGKLTIRGVLLGLAGGLCAGRFLQYMFTGVEAVDPTVYSLVLTVTILTSLGASYFPARAATRIQPMAALADE